MRKDMISSLGVVLALSPAVQTAAVSGPAVDLSGFSAALAIINTGAVAGSGDFGVKLQHSDTAVSGDFVDVPAEDMQGAAPATLPADAAFRLGYIGGKRFLRVALTKTSGTSIAAGAVIVKGMPALAPVA